MKSFLFFFFVAIGLFAQMETPLINKVHLLQESELVEDEKIKLFCKVFPKVIIAEKYEPGFVGNTIYVKLMNQKSLSECEDVNLDNFKKIETQGMIFWGLRGKYIFLKDADVLSSRTKFEIYNLETLNLVFTGARNNDHSFKTIPLGNKKLALEYFQKYNIDCDFYDDKAKAKCWKNFLKITQKNETAKDSANVEFSENFVNLPIPKCPETKNKKKHQIYLKVQIPNIETAKRKLLFAKPICEVSP
ncbi:MAG: hypothetical protein L6Q37_04395 [Bdellovibrionaceae bacterium]|nr:hypothetical protein [Pseudobdellovibrionaceae bacterium]NUM58901.1 hypothetical protein [Pseudobdellovibrionaceae bacterium]